MGYLELFLVALVMLTPVAILLVFLRYRTNITRERYRTLLQLADRGIELPHELMAEPQVPHADRRRGLVLVAGGLGVIAMFVALPFEFHDGQRISTLWGLGLLPLITGLGYVASWWLNQRDAMRG